MWSWDKFNISELSLYVLFYRNCAGGHLVIIGKLYDGYNEEFKNLKKLQILSNVCKRTVHL